MISLHADSELKLSYYTLKLIYYMLMSLGARVFIDILFQNTGRYFVH